jgi:hypothetical protein
MRFKLVEESPTQLFVDESKYFIEGALLNASNPSACQEDRLEVN